MSCATWLASLPAIQRPRSRRYIWRHAASGQLGEEVVALVVDDDEGGKIDDVDLPHGLHAELGEGEHLDLRDAVLGEARRGAADRPEVEAAVLLARRRDGG